MKLLLVRHGATEWSVTGQHTGLTDLPLTSLGHEQIACAARAVRKLHADELPDASLFSSPLQRARDTAAAISAGQLACVESDDLLECNYGDFEGLTPAQIQAIRPGWDIWRDGCPNGESMPEVGARVDAFLTRVETLDGLVIAVAHGHVLRVVAARAVGLDAQQAHVFTLDTATLSLVEDVRGKRVIRRWNLDPATLTAA